MAAAAVEAIAAAALRARLRSCGKVEVQVSASAWDLLSGRIDGAKVEGRLWESPLGLTARVLDVQVGRVELDLPGVLSQQRILLRNTPLGSARVVFNAADFGAFLQHPLVTRAARTAVQGQPFLFDRHGVAILPDRRPDPIDGSNGGSGGRGSSSGGGCVLFSGTLPATGQRYQLAMRPAQGGRRAVVVATLSTDPGPSPSPSPAAAPALSSPWATRTGGGGGAGTWQAQPQRQPQLPLRAQGLNAPGGLTHGPQGSPEPAAAATSTAATSVLVAPAPASIAEAAAAGISLVTVGGSEDGGEAGPEEEEEEEDRAVSSELSRFFSGLLVDLQGTELAFRTMRVSALQPGGRGAQVAVPGWGQGRSTGQTGAQQAAEGVLELDLSATVRTFPPLNLQF